MTGPPEPSRPTWVLAVDDDLRVLESIQLALESLGGLRVCTALDAASALESLSRVRPSMVVLDLRLPGEDVKGLVASMREQLGKEVPLLVISADERIEARAAELGAYAFLAKPFGPEELLGRVREGLRLAASR
jgi:two-component system phosphate regulon response regulator OmpR